MPGVKVSSELQKQLRAISKPIREAKGIILFRRGQPGRGAFLIRSGQVRLTLDENLDLYPARVLGSGAVIGLPASFSGQAYSLTAEVIKDCELEFIPRESLLSLLRRDPEAGLQIVRLLSDEVSCMRKAAKATARS
jgi:CRP-like cAMP-binding protein